MHEMIRQLENYDAEDCEQVNPTSSNFWKVHSSVEIDTWLGSVREPLGTRVERGARASFLGRNCDSAIYIQVKKQDLTLTYSLKWTRRAMYIYHNSMCSLIFLSSPGRANRRSICDGQCNSKTRVDHFEAFEARDCCEWSKCSPTSNLCARRGAWLI